jgi:hypothetical protein
MNRMKGGETRRGELAERACHFPEFSRRRVLILDGAMGTMVQRHSLTDADYRGTRFADHGHDLKGDTDVLVLTQPESWPASTTPTSPPAPNDRDQQTAPRWQNYGLERI